MKKYFVLAITALLITSCATTRLHKAAITPAGHWDYAITGTPEGDFFGVISIVSQDKTYSGKMMASGSELVINNFSWDETNSKVGGDFNYSGYQVYLDAVMTGEELNGSVSTEGMSFSFKATRKK